MKQEDKKQVVGRAWIKDIDTLVNWYQNNAVEWHEDAWRNLIVPKQNTPNFDLLQKVHNRHNIRRGSSFTEIQIERDIETLRQIDEYNKAMGLTMELLYHDDHMVVVRGGQICFLFPLELVGIKAYADYSSLSMRELQSLGGDAGSGLIPVDSLQDVSRNALESRKAEHEAVVQKLQEEISSVKDGTHKELADVKAEYDRILAKLEADKSVLMDNLKAKNAELMEKMKALQKQIYLLDSQIYTIRCFLGEVVEFTTIRSGSAEPVKTPVVLYQKVRYLDEELGQMASIYDLDTKDYMIIEEFLRHSDLALDRFCPAKKCIVLMRVSRSGHAYGAHDKYANMLKAYEFIHGTRICILVRNGDNLYAGWTDEDRIHVPEDLFYTPKVTQTPDIVISEDDDLHASWEKKRRIEEWERRQQSAMHDIMSRMFVFSILQGVIERGEMLQLPQEVSLVRTVSEFSQSPYIIFSAAENWLDDNRFGSFSELLARCNEVVQEGDKILTVMSLRPVHNTSWHSNDRGRGYADRTHDASVSDSTIYPVNLVEFDPEYRMVRYEHPDRFHKDRMTTSRIRANVGEDLELDEDCVVIEDKTMRDAHYYVSVPKKWSYHDARANFEVETDEFINLTYMNSSWLLYAIATKKLGGWQIGGERVNYAYAIKYLNKALEYIREREAEEQSFILPHLPELDTIADWPALLSEWKLDKRVRKINDFQAKRFARWYREKQPCSKGEEA